MASHFARPAALIPVLAALASVSLITMTLAAEGGQPGGGTGDPVWNTVIGEPLNISATAGMSQGATAAADQEGNVIVAWSDFTSGGADVYTSVSHDGGTTWSPAVNVSNDAIASTSPAPWISAAGAGVAWVSQPGLDPVGTLMTSFLPPGGSWSSPSALDDDVLPELSAGVPLDGQFKLAYWQKGTLGVELFVEALSLDGGETFGPPAEAGFEPSAPVVQANNGTDWAVELKPDGSIEVWYGKVGAFPWTLQQTIQAGARKAWIESAGDTMVVYWETKVPPVQIVKSVYDGGVWSDPEPVSDGSHSASGPDFAEFAQYGFFIWFQVNPITHNSQVVGRASTDGGATFSETVEITPPEVAASDAVVTVDGDGRAYSVYDALAGSSSHRELVVARLKELGPPQFNAVVGLNKDFDLTRAILGWVGVLAPHAQAAPAALEARVLLLGTMPPEGDYVPDIFVARTGLAGDSDCNGATNSVDALAVLRSVAGLPSTAACLALANVNCAGGAPNSVDSLLILRSVAGLPVNVPADCPSVG